MDMCYVKYLPLTLALADKNMSLSLGVGNNADQGFVDPILY